MENLCNNVPVTKFVFPKSKLKWLESDLIEYIKERDAAL